MKATLEFELPKENDEFLNAYRGSDWHALFQKYDNYLRNEMKYHDKKGSFQEARDRLTDLAHEYGLIVWE